MSSRNVDFCSVSRPAVSITSSGPVREVSRKDGWGGSVEIIDSAELGRRLAVPASWIKAHTRGRTTDPIPHLKLGRYTRFTWGSPELTSWISEHFRG